MNSINNSSNRVDLHLNYCKSNFYTSKNNRTQVCKAKILYLLGELYTTGSKHDSAQFYLDSSIQLAESIEAWEQLVSGFCRKAMLEIYRNQLDEAEALLKRAKTILDKGQGQDCYTRLLQPNGYSNKYYKQPSCCNQLHRFFFNRRWNRANGNG